MHVYVWYVHVRDCVIKRYRTEAIIFNLCCILLLNDNSSIYWLFTNITTTFLRLNNCMHIFTGALIVMKITVDT